jgi:XTP/dITP diphosphohydrolase
MDIIFASANTNKIKEISAMLSGKYHLLGLKDVGIDYEIPEPGATIRENSFLKADHVLNVLKQQGRSQMPVFADDSGLEVEALKGAPGVHSARYAGVPKNDINNNKKLLEELRHATNRKARFVTIITLLLNNQVHYFEGEVTGTITYEACGNSGFGYDPLFVPTGYRSTFAELGVEIKNSISHRALAVKKLVAFLSEKG